MATLGYIAYNTCKENPTPFTVNMDNGNASAHRSFAWLDLALGAGAAATAIILAASCHMVVIPIILGVLAMTMMSMGASYAHSAAYPSSGRHIDLVITQNKSHLGAAGKRHNQRLIKKIISLQKQLGYKPNSGRVVPQAIQNLRKQMYRVK